MTNGSIATTVKAFYIFILSDNHIIDLRDKQKVGVL